jgi:WD40 repeat protein/tetratricopeptide (TPR) repeat protein/predicted Ser/Thr protein kinase
MTTNLPPSDDRETRLEKVLADYLHGVDAGLQPSEQELLTAHPDLAEELRSFFRNRAAIERLAAPLNESADTPTLLQGGGSVAATSERPKVRYFGDYELLEELGRGGMGVVYKARQTTLNRFVALKMILSGELASPDDVHRFRQEAEAAANLDHPNIAPIYETGEHQGQQYFSMKLIEGPSLRKAWDVADSTSVERGVRLLASVARAVHHAHQRGVLHRDIKPGNVLLDLDGIPYVTDFGLAKRVEGGSDVTRTGAIVGTPSYMAPEQARAEKVLTTAVDVYSLGAMLYERLTGRPPFREASPIKTLLESLSNEPLRPSAINPSANRDLETIALKCLDKDPAKRYDSAAALADDLERWLAGEPITARPVSSWERGLKWARRNPIIAALTTCIVLVLGAGVAGVVWQWQQAVELRLLAESRAEENQQRIVHQYVSHGTNALEQDRPLEALVWFAEALRLERPDALRQEPHRRRWGALGRQVPRLVHVFAHEQNAQAAFSPDGRRIVTWSGTRVRLWDAQSGLPLAESLVLPDVVWNVVFSLDSKQIVVASCPGNLPDSRTYTGYISIFNCDNATQAGSTRHVQQLNAWHVQFTPDGKQVLFSTEQQIELHDVLNWNQAWPAIKHRLRIRGLAISPDSQRLLVNFGEIEGENEVQLFDLENGASIGTVMPDQEFGIDSPFSPDGRFFATYTPDSTGGRGDGPTAAQVWDCATGKSRAQVTFPRAVRRLLLVGRDPAIVAHLNDELLYFCSPLAGDPALTHWGHRIWTFAVSPEGQLIAAQHRESRTIEIFNREMVGYLHSSFPIATTADHLTFSPDGQRVAVSARGPEARQGTVHLIDLNSHERMAMQVGHQYGQLTTAFSSNGRQLLTADEDGFVRTWDVTTLGSQLRQLAELNDRGVSVLELSPQEKWLAVGQGHHDIAVERGGAEPFGLLRVWNLADGAPVGPEVKFTSRVEAVRFSDDERRAAATLSDGSVAIVDVVTGQQLEEFAADQGGYSFALLGGGDEVVLQRTRRRFGYGVESLPPGTIERHRIGTSLPLSTVAIGEHQLAQLTPRGDRVLIVQPSLDAVLLDTATGQTSVSLGRLHGHVRQAEFSRDGRRLALVFDDEIAEIWDLERTRIAAKLIRQVEVVRFSHRGTELLAGKEGTYRVWDAVTGEPLSGPYLVGQAINRPRMEAKPVLGPNANSLLSTAGDRLREWNLAPDERPVEHIVELAQVHSGHGIDEIGGYAAQPRLKLAATWQAFTRSSRIEQRSPVAAEVTAWHERESWQCEVQLPPGVPLPGEGRSPALGVRLHLGALLASRPEGTLYKRRGVAQLVLGDAAAAVADFDAAVQHGLNADPLIYLYRGRANDLAGNRDAGIADVTHAFELGQRELLNPRTEWERQAAIQGLHRWLELKNDDWERLELRTTLEWEIHDFAACLRDIDRLLAAGRTTYFLPHWRAWCLSMVDRGEEAIAEFTRNLGDEEDDPDELVGRAYAYARLGRFKSAADDFEKSRHLFAYPLTVLQRAAIMHLLAGDQAGYRRCCDESWNILRHNYGDNPQRVDSHTAAEVARTCVLAKGGTDRLDVILALARQGARGNEGKSQAAETLALALCRQGEPVEALATLASVQANGAVASAIRSLANHLKDDSDEAQKWLTTAERELTDLPQFSSGNRYLVQALVKELYATLGK